MVLRKHTVIKYCKKLIIYYNGRCTHQQDVAIIINNVTMQRIQVTKCLGVLIDESLNWKNHITMVKSKLSKVASVTYKVV